MVDDRLDGPGQAAHVGKTPGKDARLGKRTHAIEVGLDQAGQLREELTGRAIEALRPLGPPGGELRKLAELLAQRAEDSPPSICQRP